VGAGEVLLHEIETLRVISFLFEQVLQPKSQTLRQNRMVLRRAALSGPERAPTVLNGAGI